MTSCEQSEQSVIGVWETDNEKVLAALKAQECYKRAAGRAASKRRAWARVGRMSREEYDKLPSSPSHKVQDEIVVRHRRREGRAVIQAAIPGVSELAIKNVIRVFRNDPEAFRFRIDEEISTPAPR